MLVSTITITNSSIGTYDIIDTIFHLNTTFSHDTLLCNQLQQGKRVEEVKFVTYSSNSTKKSRSRMPRHCQHQQQLMANSKRGDPRIIHQSRTSQILIQSMKALVVTELSLMVWQTRDIYQNMMEPGYHHWSGSGCALRRCKQKNEGV